MRRNSQGSSSERCGGGPARRYGPSRMQLSRSVQCKSPCHDVLMCAQLASPRKPVPHLLSAQSATLAVPLPVVPTPAECAALLRTLVKHLLFQRAQIPFLYDELLRAACERQRAEAEAPAGNDAGAARRRRRAPKGDRRLLKVSTALLCLVPALQAAVPATRLALGCQLPATM